MNKKPETDRLSWMLASALELPKDLVIDLPRITIVGQYEFHLENHKGIIEYGTDNIKISLSRGYLELEGENLEIKVIMQDELRVIGLIKSLRFVA